MSPTYDNFWEEIYSGTHIAMLKKNNEYLVYIDKTLVTGLKFKDPRDAKIWLRNKVDGVDHESRQTGRWTKI
jgi:hypothetical protein